MHSDRTRSAKSNPLPGFGITLGFTVLYLSVLVLIPIAVLSLKALSLSWSELWRLAMNDRALAAYRLSLGASFAAALLNAAFGSLLAWRLALAVFGSAISVHWVILPVCLAAALVVTLAGSALPLGQALKISPSLALRD